MTTPRRGFPRAIPFVETLGFELRRFGDGEAEIAHDPGEGHLNSYRVAHGGLLMTLLDVAMAHAAVSPRGGEPPEPGTGAVTIEMKTSFLHPAEGPLVAHGRLLQPARSVAFCEGEVRDAHGRLCAHATGTFKLKRRPAGAASHTPDAPAAAVTNPSRSASE